MDLISTSCKVLVAIASYGNAQDHFLRRVVAEYRPLQERCRIVVLSNIDKQIEGAEVRVGVPTRDPYSLPFAHRAVFAENAAGFDLFIYTEDDTLLTVESIEAFLNAQRQLEDDEIAGFLRSEVRTDGGRQVVSVNHHFRWIPDTVVRRGTDWYAKFSNQHSGCYMVTRAQLQRAIASGGFLVEPRRRRYGMLETAASDIYTQCGLRRLVNLSRIDEFIVPHLANKYFTRMGIPIEDLHAQVHVLQGISAAGTWSGSLVDPQANTPHFRWSKNLYAGADRSLLSAMPAGARSVLSVGASWGANEHALVQRGLDVMAVPIDAVFGRHLESLGVGVVQGELDKVMRRLNGRRFDVVLLDDVLHRTKQPTQWLDALQRVLAPEGRIVGSIPVAPNALSILRDVRDGIRPVVPRFESHGLHASNRGRLKQWLARARLEAVTIVPEPEPRDDADRESVIGYLKSRMPARLIFAAQSRT